jgi:hypothetical protein
VVAVDTVVTEEETVAVVGMIAMTTAEETVTVTGVSTYKYFELILLRPCFL